MSPSLESTAWIRTLERVIDAALAVLVFAFAAMSLSGLFYRAAALDRLQYGLVPFFLLAGLRVFLAPAWHGVWRRSDRFAAAAGLIGFAVMWAAGSWTLDHALLVALETTLNARFSSQPSTELEALQRYEHDRPTYNSDFHRAAFMIEVAKAVPEDGRIAYVSDLRAEVLQYMLYPRRIYALNAQQEAMLWQAQEKDSKRVDPLWAARELRNPRPGFSREGADAEFAQMIEDKKIGWLIVYDSAHPDMNRIVRLDK